MTNPHDFPSGEMLDVHNLLMHRCTACNVQLTAAQVNSSCPVCYAQDPAKEAEEPPEPKDCHCGRQFNGPGYECLSCSVY